MVRTMEVWDMLSPGRPNLYKGGVPLSRRLGASQWEGVGEEVAVAADRFCVRQDQRTFRPRRYRENRRTEEILTGVFEERRIFRLSNDFFIDLSRLVTRQDLAAHLLTVGDEDKIGQRRVFGEREEVGPLNRHRVRIAEDLFNPGLRGSTIPARRFRAWGGS